ncbi:hypothetical protein SISSUDRAFT_1062700 [Sistotremastrum suecicum HHB10207 ss-3]|uniref:DRBM domain-containing protein n=1 Tax=Sistotremastrum suecicum HHB10207 ss-3 TaxID=1314776 RepID=A0A166CLT7_9AGAM|nr:hypothetical protein SISSUDRAFT_1062700 [Sistotremastrum suecicum HHB10207 ss-3]
MADFKAVILGHTFVSSTQKPYVTQLTELAAQNRVTLEWAELREGPEQTTIWYCYPIVNGQAWASYNQAGSSKKEAKEKSAAETVRMLRRSNGGK